MKFKNSTTTDCVYQVKMGGSVGYAPDVDRPQLISGRILLGILSLCTVNLFLINKTEAMILLSYPWFVTAIVPSSILPRKLGLVVSSLAALKAGAGGRP
jgi:hypothetical protein